jgi:amino acid transporter
MSTEVAEGLPSEEPGQLRHGALSLTGAIMQGVTHIAPTAGVVLIVQSEVGSLGNAVPFAFVLAILVMLLIGLSLAQLARFLPSAGGLYTYISNALSPRLGWFSGWVNLLYDPFGTAIDLAALGYLLHAALQSNYNFNFPWWVTFALGAVVVTFLIYRGITITGKAQVILGGLELAILLAVCIQAMFSPGPGGVSLTVFNPGTAPSGSNLFVAVILAVFTFAGFESVAPLAEETREPRRNVPRAMIGSLVIVGLFVIFCIWAQMVGWGLNDLGHLATYSGNPVFEVTKRLWGPAWVILLFAIVNSLLSVSIATTNSSTRVIYAMGRNGALPAWFSRVHPRYGSPVNALIAQTILTVALGYVLGFIMGPFNLFLMMGIAITLALALLYILSCLGVIRFFASFERRHFNPILHVVIPLAAAVAVGFVIYHTVTPTPPYPLNISLYVAGGWILAGIVVSVILIRTGRASWLEKSTRIYAEPEGGLAGDSPVTATAAPTSGPRDAAER